MALVMERARSAWSVVLGTLTTLVLLLPERTTVAPEVPASAIPPLHTAVLRDGFAIFEQVGERAITEVARAGTRRRRTPIPTTTDTRVVGTSNGPGIVYLEKKKVQFQVLHDDGKLGRQFTFGTSVRQLCDGAASNDERWAVGYLEERDDRLWFVHGPTPRRSTATDAESAVAVSTAASWCAVRSAHDYVALLYREGQKTFAMMCSKKECGVQTRIPVDPRDTILDAACQREGCVVAVRGSKGLSLRAFTLRGKLAWEKPLPYATSDELHLAAAGDRAYTLSLMTDEGPIVERMLSKTGSGGRSWHGARGLTVPALAWSKDHMMITYWDEGSLAHDVWVMPR